jgi:hypothetical protein
MLRSSSTTIDVGDSAPSWRLASTAAHARFRRTDMDADRFDALTRSLSSTASSRRRLLTGVAGSALGALAAALGFTAADATHVVCRHVGERCRRSGQCCSSRCRNKRCRAHGTLNCAPGTPDQFCFVGTCGDGTCGCTNTTGGSSFCSDSVSCYPQGCTTDKQCDALTGIPGSACVECETCTTTAGRGCAAPCTTP